PWLMGGSADLAPSCKTRLTFEGAGDFSADTPGGRNLHFGIREHVMASVLNGMALIKVRAYGSSFLIFSDYAKPAIRLSALMELPVVYVFTHDSIGVGEDGPTHQPVEQASACGWSKYGGTTGHSIGMRSFAASAPLTDLIKKFGFAPEDVVAAARTQVRLSKPEAGRS